VNTLPYACLHPFVQATPAGHSATAPELTRQILPRYSSPDNKQIPVSVARSLMRGRPPLGDGGRTGR
jgi:hypothetical protein